MADLAIGISRTAVQLLADKVKSAIKEDAEKWQIVERDLVFITGEFEMMQSFLDTADEEHVKNRVVRTWVRQVRDLSYGVEDCIEFVLHLDTEKRTWWFSLLPSCGKASAALPVDEAVTQIMQLKARVVDVSQRNIRYNLISDSGSNQGAQVQRKAATSTDTLIDAAKMQGGHQSDLIKVVTRDDSDLQVISVCATRGDLGMICIKNVYNDSIVCEKFRCRAWVKLTHPFNPREFIQNLVVQFYTNYFQEQGGAIIGLDVLQMMEITQGDVVNEFMEQVNNQRYLIILEDISTMVQWHAIMSYLPDRKNGSRIIVSTQQLEITRLCTGLPYRMLELSQLSADHSVRVFFKEDFQHGIVHSFIKEEPYHSLCKYGLLFRDSEVDELSEHIQEGHLISVWGMPGVGKSVLVGAIFYKPRTDGFEKQAWVNVCYPFNPTNFCLSLLLDLHSESNSMEEIYSKSLQAEDPIKECWRLLHEHKCLVVIDGLQSKDDWDWIKSKLLQCGHCGSCVMIITSEESVARYCSSVSNNASYNVRGLKDVEARKLLVKVLEDSGSYLERQMSVEVSRLMSKCGGLPKVIVTLARYLANRPRDVLKQEMTRLSDNFMHELAANPELDSLHSLHAWMHHYVHYFPRHLKSCMLYLSIFPLDSIIRRRCMVRRWIAEGYSKGTDSNFMEKYAENIFDEVAALGIMKPVLKASKVIGYRCNGFFREYITSRPVEERIFFPVEVSELEKGHEYDRQLTTEGIGQHLAIGSTWECDKVLFESLDFSRLRSLTIFSWFSPIYVSDRMRVLRVLDLGNAKDVGDCHFEIIRKLPPRLKFLSLRGQIHVSRLPDSVGDLMQLQTLDIRDTSIVTLPPFITSLQKLQYIRAGTSTMSWKHDDRSGATEHPTPPCRWSNALASRLLARFRRHGPDASCSVGVEVPRGIKRLKDLQTLGAININNSDGDAILDEIVRFN